MIGLRLPAVVVAAALGAAIPAAQDPGTPLASIHVAVEDEDGRPVTDIRPDEFTLLLANVPVPIAQVSRGPHPLRLIVIVDVTTRPPVDVRTLREGIDQLGGALRDGDEAQVWRVGGRITRGPAFTREPGSRRTAAAFAVNPANVERSGPSPIWDAIVEASDALDGEDGRRAILIYTDGRATANRHGGADAAARALAAGVSVNVVMPAGEFRFMNLDRIVTVHPDRMPQAIARDTGGAFVPLPPRLRPAAEKPPPSFGEALAAIVTGLQGEYVLRVARPEGEHRLVEVRVNRPGLTLRARRAI
jgi:hypothetical protein